MKCFSFMLNHCTEGWAEEGSRGRGGRGVGAIQKIPHFCIFVGIMCLLYPSYNKSRIDGVKNTSNSNGTFLMWEQF